MQPRIDGWWICVLVGAVVSGCATQRNSQHSVELRQQLREAMQKSVTSREQRDEQSQLMMKVVKADAVDGMTRPEVRAAFGPGVACTLDVCHKNGFEESDWYYEIGVHTSGKIEQLPLLLFKFDPHERTVRVFTLSSD